MRLLLFVSLAILLTMTAYYWHLARRGLRAARRVARLATRPVAKLEEGPVEVAGLLRAVQRPIRAPSGRRCVYAEVKVDAYTSPGKHRERVHSEVVERKVEAVLVDESGEARVDLEHVEVVGPSKLINGGRGQLKPSTKSWTKDVSDRAKHFQISETIVKHDVHVVISGRAKVTGSKVEMGEGGYRDGAPVERRSFLVHGTAEEPALVFEGTERRLLWQASWPVALLFVAGLVALAFASVVVAVIAA